MIYALVAAGFLLIVVGSFARSLFGTIVRLVDGDRAKHERERTLHHEQVRRLIDDFAGERHGLTSHIASLVAYANEERRDWTAERSILLNRIQDPGAGVAMSMATLPPPADLDVDLTR